MPSDDAESKWDNNGEASTYSANKTGRANSYETVDSDTYVQSEREVLTELVAHNQAQRRGALSLLRESRIRAVQLGLLGATCWVLAIVVFTLVIFNLGFDKALSLSLPSHLPADAAGLMKFAPGVLVVIVYVAFELTSAANKLYFASRPLAEVLAWQKETDNQMDVGQFYDSPSPKAAYSTSEAAGE